MNRLEFIGLMVEVEVGVNEARTMIQRGRDYPSAYRKLEKAREMLRVATAEAAAYAVAWGEPINANS